MTTFESLLAELGRAEVDFIVVGGLAVAFAGFPRATDDLDILVSAERRNLERLLEVLRRFGQGAATELDVTDFPLEEGCVRVAEDFDVDIFTLMSGYSFEDLLPLAAEARVQDAAVLFLSAKGLLQLKADSLRPKDQLDVQVLREILRGTGPSNQS
jgi:hypothetical protein